MLALSRSFGTASRASRLSAAPLRAYPVRAYSTGAPSLLELVKALRKETKAGIADCRDALEASNNDLEQAKLWLVERAKKTADKKRDRKTQEGGMVAYVKGSQALIMELNTETDFASKEPEFLKTARLIADAILAASSRPASKEDLLAVPCSFEVAGIKVSTIGEAVQQLTFLFKENIQLSRASLLPADVNEVNDNTLLYSYVHCPLDGQKPQIGKLASLVQLKVDSKPNAGQLEKIEKFAHMVCIQVVGGKPTILSKEHQAPAYVDPSNFDGEDDYEPQLLEQESVLENGTIKGLQEKISKSTGLKVTISDFARWELNQGKERDVSDLAADVKSMLE